MNPQNLLTKLHDPKFWYAIFGTVISIVLIAGILKDPHVDQVTKLDKVQNIGQILLGLWGAAILGTAIHQYGQSSNPTQPAPGPSPQPTQPDPIQELIGMVKDHPKTFTDIYERLQLIEKMISPIAPAQPSVQGIQPTTLQQIHQMKQAMAQVPGRIPAPPAKFPPVEELATNRYGGI